MRSDPGAVDFLNINHAAAATIDSSTILVHPEYRANDFVLSHELVHIAQLRRGLSGSVEQSEISARGAATTLLHGYVPHTIGAAAPPPLFLHFTGGAFDQALDNASIQESVLKRLKASKAFLSIVSTLDNHYVARDNKRLTSGDVAAMKDGVLQTGRFKGKRLLYIQTAYSGPRFVPMGGELNDAGGDLINIDTGQSDLEALRSLVHETTHAFRFITGKTAPKDPLVGDDKPEKVEAAIQAGITEEQETRKSEINIAQGVYSTKSKERATLQEAVDTGYLSRPQIERDLPPAIDLTYLESSAFDTLLAEAKLTEKLSDDQAKEIRDQIDKGPMKKIPMVKRKTTVKSQPTWDEPSQYAFIYKNRQIAIATWQEFKKKFDGRLDSPEAQKEKERQLQENAHVFLDNRIHYSPLK